MDNSLQRENWSSRIGTIMAMAGMAIGLGNCWRFPYLVGIHGGGTFVFAYLVVLIIIVIPLALVEAGLGKGLQAGEIDAWSEILHNKIGGKTVGGVFSIAYATENFFYMFVTGSTIYYIFVFIRDLPHKEEATKIYNDMNFHQSTVMLILTGLVTLMVIVALYAGIVKGIEVMSKIMVPSILIIFAVITIFSAFTVHGITSGYNYYLNPHWNELADFSLWKDALGQALFSVGVGPGCILVYGSHIKKHSDVTLSIATVCVLDTTAALLAGFAIIPTCIALGLDPESGSGLIFIVLPKALSMIPGGMILGILAMIAIFFAAFTSAMAQMEVAVTSFSDGFKFNRKLTVIITGAITMVMALICVVNKGQFDFWNNFAGNYAFIVTAGLGAIFYNYVYGTKKIREGFLNDGGYFKLGKWFDPLVKFVAVPLMVIVMADSLFPFLSNL